MPTDQLNTTQPHSTIAKHRDRLGISSRKQMMTPRR